MGNIYEDPHYALFSVSLLIPTSWVQILSSAACSLTPSIYASFGTSETSVSYHNAIRHHNPEELMSFQAMYAPWRGVFSAYIRNVL